jgi:putative transposase
MHGLPEKVLTDNAREFRGYSMIRGCEEFGIQIAYRPVGRPYYGGHVERLIGTLMKRVHSVPGTSFSDVDELGDYDPKTHACMTLREFENWLANEICSRYHHTVHSSIGMTPAAAWEASMQQSSRVA